MQNIESKIKSDGYESYVSTVSELMSVRERGGGIRGNR